MNYVQLLQRISVMLEDIGCRLPRLELYLELLPSQRMSRIVSELYAAMLKFLSQTIIFFNKRRSRRLFSILWGPFEGQYRQTIDRIERLSLCVEQDAQASAFVHQQSVTSALALKVQEQSLVTRHTLYSVLEIKQQQTTTLLGGIRRSLFRNFDHDLQYQYDMMRVCTSLVSHEWTPWYFEEMRHVPFYRKEQSAFSYVQSETLQPLVMANILWQKPASMEYRYLPHTYLFWTPQMTVESAVACLIFQYLELYPEKLLFRHEADYYARKFEDGTLSVGRLLETYLQLVSALPGSRCMMIIPFDSIQAAEFVKKVMEYCQHWSSNRHSIVIYHITDPDLSSEPDTIELDNEYDIDRRMDTSENLFRVLAMELGIFGNLTQDIRTSLWSCLWRTIRYNLIVLIYERMISRVGSASSMDGTRPPGSSAELQLAQASLKRGIIALFHCVQREMPGDCQTHLEQLIKASDCLSRLDRATTPPPGPLSSPSQTASATEPPLLTFDQRLELWGVVEDILQATVHTFFEPLARDLFSSTHLHPRTSASVKLTLPELLHLLESCFCINEWDDHAVQDMQSRTLEAIESAAGAGLRRILDMYA